MMSLIRSSVYLRLIRLDKPDAIGLLYLPCLWTLLAYTPDMLSLARYAIVFLAGAVLTRSAGCILNDIADKNIDRQVPRTAGRPLASGELSRKKALLLVVILAFVTAPLLWFVPPGARYVAVVAAVLTCLYPLAKRVTALPQAVLAVTFNCGIIMAGFTAPDSFPFVGIVTLYAAACFWTFGYDTIYALPDKEADALIGMQSAPLTLGTYTRPVVAVCYGLFYTLIGGYVVLSDPPNMTAYGLLGMSAVLSCLLLLSHKTSKMAQRHFFRGNVIAGVLIALAFAALRFAHTS